MAGLDSTEVWFFDGQVRVDQPRTGYRAGTDAILMAMATQLKPSARVLDMGTGSGVLPCLIHHRFPTCEITGFENSADMLALARHNTRHIDQITITEQDIATIPASANQTFDVVVSNPPFFDDINAVRMSEEKRPSFVSDRLSLKDWVETMVLMLKPRAVGSLICRADRIEAVFAGVYGKAGRIRILPIHSYAETPAKRVIVEFRKGVKSESKILPALVMHDENGDTRYKKSTQAILNGQKPIIMG